MTIPIRRRSRAVLAIAVAAALTVTACGSSKKNGGNATGDKSAPGVTSDSILLGTTQPLTGPAAPGYSKISAAMKAYFAFVNQKGGVNGRKITLNVEDDGYNPANTATKTRKLVLQDKVFALVGALGTPTHTAVLDFVNQNKVPDLFVSSGSRSWNQPSKYPMTFGWQTDYTVEGKVLGDYIKKNFAGKTVCSFGQGDDFGTDGAQGVELTLGQGSLKSKQTYTPTNTNVAPQIGALKAAGCQVVVSFTVPGFTALALGTAAKLKYQPQWVISNVGSDIVTLQGFLKDATTPLLEGAVTDLYMPIPSDSSNSWIKLFQMVNEKYNNNVPFDGNVEYGMASAYTFAEALAAAGQNPTRASLVAAVENQHFAGANLVPYAFSSTDHSGLTGMQMDVIKGLSIKFMGTPLVTDDGNGPVTPYTTPQATAPANGIPTS